MMGIELEEGDALPRFSDIDDNIDPDKDFSYIDKKIQDVLGQFQRDFMGEVSVENLGTRFGGYGSFLPSYQHSPSTFTHARNQSHISSRSPHNTPLEGASLYSVRTNNYLPRRVSSSNCIALQSLSVRGSEDATILSVTEALSTDSLKHQNSGCYVDNKESKGLPRNKPIQNPLKFRVKVVSDSLLPRDNSAIYSGLGLDMSPSISLEDIPSEVDEASPNMLEMPEGSQVSPSCIIEIMTSFPVPAVQIMSPLHGSLLHLVEYQSKLGNGRAGPQQVVSLRVGHESALSQRKTEVNRQMNIRKKDNNVEMKQVRKEINKGQADVSCPSLVSGVKKVNVSKMSDLAVSVDKLSASGHSFVCNGKDEVGYLDEVNGKSLKHQLAAKDKEKELGSDSVSVLVADLKDRQWTIGVGVAAKKGMDSSVPINDAILNEANEDSSSSDSIKPMSQRGPLLQNRREELLDSITFKDSDVSNEKQSNETEKASKSNKVNFPLRRDAEDGGGVCKVNHDVTWGIKDHYSKPLESSIENLDLKGIPSFKKEALPKGKKYSSSVGRKKSKKSRNDDRLAAKLPNFPSGLSSSPAQAETPALRIKFPSKCGTDDLKPGKELRNLKDALDEMHSETNIKKKERIKDPKNSVHGILMGGTRPSNGKVKAKAGEKVTEYSFNPGPNLKDDQSISNPSTEITFSGALQTHNAFEADNWVQCDKCQKWRLLPNGLLPACLPNKWICRMLDWLPGMNKCSFSEDDTTNALRAQYHIPASVPEKHNIQPDCSKGGVRMTASVALQRSVALSQLSTPETLPGVKNGHAQQLQNYAENDQQYSFELGNPKKSSQSAVHLNSVQGNVEAKPFKKEQKREADEDLSGVTKKVKKVQQQSKKEQSPAGMVSKGSRDGQNCSTSSSEVSKEFLLVSSSMSVKKIKDTVHGMINTLRSEVKDVSRKKRKLTNELNSTSYTESSDCKEQISMDNQVVENMALETEVNGGSEHVGEKNKKRSKGIELHKKEHFTKMEDTKVNPAICKDAASEDMSAVQCHVDNISHKSLEGRKSSRGDKELVLPCATPATSNSSKLSGPCKVKVKHREMKYSPAVSISSYPFKVLRDHDSNGNKVSESHNEPENLLSVKRLNSGPLDEIIRCVKSGMPQNLVTKYDYDDEDLFARTVGEHKQSSSMKHHAEHGIEKQQKLDVGRDAHRKPKPSVSEGRFNASHQQVVPRIPGKRSLNQSDKVKLKNVVPSGSGKGNPSLSKCVSASENGDERVTTEVDNCDLKFPKQLVDGDPHNGDVGDGNNGLIHGMRHNRGDGMSADDIEASRSLKKDGFQNSDLLLKEAKELKRTADRLKKISSTRETAVVVFQAALKFLIGASLVEPSQTKIARTTGTISPSEVYKTTADFCEYWAREFERCNDMALAALAYKCMEVACMRVVYCNDAAANRDQHELQTDRRSVTQVDSPSSSASDIDNLNHQAVISSIKDLHFPVVNGNFVMPAGTMPNLFRLLNFTRDVHRAMEATGKYQRAFAVAHSSLSKARNVEGISSLKRVLDFSFLDLGGLLHIVSLAMEALGG